MTAPSRLVTAPPEPASGPDAPTRAFGVYVHVPFCSHRCDYCDFATWVDRLHLAEDYVGACVADLRSRRREGRILPATSVFFGGGTPSLLPAAALLSVLAQIDLAPGAEVTVECNPESVDGAKLAAYREAGVNRLSFGVQSMVPRVLEALGRRHDPDSVARAVRDARAAGFESLNLDLVFGAASESIEDWRETVEAALALDPPHVSAYALTVEAGTPLARRISVGEVSGPDEDDQAEKYELADELLEGNGRPWYEISSWARPGFECRHHLLYWSQGDYLGIGCAAHGHLDGRRWWNVRAPERYIERVSAGVSPEAGHEALVGAERREEALVLGLRTRWGVEVDDDAGLVRDGLARHAGSRLVLTPRGRLLANEATTRILVRQESRMAPGGASRGALSGEKASSGGKASSSR